MISFKKLEKSFGKNHVLKQFNLDLIDNGITAVIGPNGSGKTTLIKCLLGLCIPDSGDIHFNSKSILGAYQYRNSISYLPQIARFPENLSGSEVIEMIEHIKSGASRKTKLIKLFDFESELNKKVSKLSGGYQQKLNLIICLMYDNPVIILDEPSNGLDPVALINLKKFLKEEKDSGKQIFLTTHIMSFVEELADKVVFLLEGCVYYEGSLFDLLANQETNKLEEAIARIIANQNLNSHVKSI